ncbi:MAG: flagellar biosynthesis protein FlhF [Treponema sp.]|jgi:flagellar biosynthesis protein FlhF|nr:flagellar biosynthesis protein FlhF [Treponema sp.]
MPYFTEQAKTHGDCLKKINTKYGKDARVLIEKTVRKGGIFGLGSHEEVEMTGTYGLALSLPADRLPAPFLDRQPVPVDLETAKRQVLAAAGKTVPDVAIQTVLKEIAALNGTLRNLNEKVDATIQSSWIDRGQIQELHPALQKLEEDLLLNEFTPSFVKTILEKVRKEFPLHELDDYEEVQKRIVRWIGEQILIYKEPEPVSHVHAASSGERKSTSLHPRAEGPHGKKKPRIIVLVGPTGVGKTTTLVKLAALYGELDRNQGIWQKQVRLITLDCYRIGAEKQIEKYGEIMEVPVNSADSYDSLKQLLNLYRQDVDFILIDTIGKSPRNYTELGEMKAMLDAIPTKAEVHLCVQASTKSGDLREILKQFEPFKYKSVVITKMDETGRIGNVISILAEERKNISFLTKGQTVPWDIERAAVIHLLVNLDGFIIDRHALVDHFRGA